MGRAPHARHALGTPLCDQKSSKKSKTTERPFSVTQRCDGAALYNYLTTLLFVSHRRTVVPPGHALHAVRLAMRRGPPVQVYSMPSDSSLRKSVLFRKLRNGRTSFLEYSTGHRAQLLFREKKDQTSLLTCCALCPVDSFHALGGGSMPWHGLGAPRVYTAYHTRKHAWRRKTSRLKSVI